MPRYRRRRSQISGWFLLIAFVLALWYLGKIPGLPPLTTVLPGFKPVGTFFPVFTAIAPLIPDATATASPMPSSSASPLGQRTQTSGCVAANALPDPECTPGAVFPDVTREKVCTPGYSSTVRDVSQSVKEQVYAEYGVASHEPGQYEVDHLIALSIGGSNDIANLWPQPGEPRPGYHEKDDVEIYLHQQVCDGAMSLQAAQSLMAHDWYAVYQAIPK